MRYNFCTNFDKNFLARGMVLHESLMRRCDDFVLYMLCMDDESYDMLEKLRLENVIPLALKDVEDARLVAVKPTRTPVEYCWMFSSSMPLYLLEHYPELDHITYLDADLYFYSSPEPIYDEFGDASIMIIPHGFSEKNRDKEKMSGTYNVGMMIFKRDENALEALRWWKDRVIEWCYYRYEDGKLGDQLYLNDWPDRFKGVHVLKHPGANVASWNLDRFSFARSGDEFRGTERKNGKKFHLIFYHFHGLKIYFDKNNHASFYPVTNLHSQIYEAYRVSINKAYRRLRSIDSLWIYGTVAPLDAVRKLKQSFVKLFQS